MADAYRTRQRETLVKYLAEHGDSPMTAGEIAEGLHGEESAPGRSTVYRLLTRLCDEGTVKRGIAENGREQTYRMAAEACHRHLHLKCVHCGKLGHMDEQLSQQILDEVKGLADFTVDREETVLLGCCRDCREKAQHD